MDLRLTPSKCMKRCLVLLVVCTLLLLGLSLRWKSSKTLKTRGTFERRATVPLHKKGGLKGMVRGISSLFKSFTSAGGDSSQFGVNNSAFHTMLLRHASPERLIYLSSVDSGYLDMALNLYFSSFKKLAMTNYLFVASDSRVCQQMAVYNISCFDYIHDKDAASASGYFSEAFKRKTHLKTKIILEALKLNLKVVITDVDIVFFKDPTSYFTCSDCDIEISSDVIEGNSGFYLARPTQSTVKLHSDAWKQGLAKPKISNQKALDRLMEKMSKRKQIKIRYLDSKTFANGLVFFEENRRMFKGDNPCVDCVILHNNWIVSGAAKIYRFREIGLWDSDHKLYYSHPNRKYLSFDLPVDFSRESKPEELVALKNAFMIGHILNRTVILPKFHCYGCKFNKVCDAQHVMNAKCTFGTFYKIDKFEESFRDNYRENTFLSHELVPLSVKQSLSAVYLIQSPKSEQRITQPPGVRLLTPRNGVVGPTESEIRHWFDDVRNTASVLRFHSLYVSLNVTLEKTFHKKLETAFRASDFRQY